MSLPSLHQKQELCAAVRHLLLTMCPEPQERQADATYVAARRGAAAGMAYLSVRQLLAALAEDFPPAAPKQRVTDRRQTDRRSGPLPELQEMVEGKKRLDAELARAARYGKG